MIKTLTSLAAAVSVAAVMTASPAPAEARCFGCVVGGAILGGAIIGGAIASSAPRYYAPVPGYVVYPDYGAPPPYGCPGGYWARRPLLDPYGNVVGYGRPRFFCP